MNYKMKAVSGYYKDHYCRSLHEFHACLYFDLVKKYDIIMEPCKIKSLNSDKCKIPDMAVINTDCCSIDFIEIKHTQTEIENLIVKYAELKYRIPDTFATQVKSKGFLINFRFMHDCSKNLKPLIISSIGKSEYLSLLKTYKLQRKSYTGFPGVLNPMYGKRHSKEAKALISKNIADKGGRFGSKNVMYGKTHSSKAKVNIGAKWYVLNTKHTILRNSLINRIDKLTLEQYDIFVSHVIRQLSGDISKRPDFMNGIIATTPDKITEVFGTYENFWNFVRVQRD